MKKARTHLSIIMALVLITQPVMATDAPYEWPEESDNRMTFMGELIDDGEEHEHGATLSLSVEEAVAYGLGHNLDLESLANQALLASVAYSNADDIADALEDAETSLEAAEVSLASSEDELDEAKEDLVTAWSLINSGRSPVDYEVSDSLTLSSGEDIEDAVESAVEDAITEMEATILAYYEAVIAGGYAEAIGSTAAEATAALESGNAPFDYSFDVYSFTAGEDLADKCEWYIIYSLSEGVYTDADDYIEASTESITEAIIESLEESEEEIAESDVAITEAFATIEAGWSTYTALLSDATRETEDNLNYGSSIYSDLEAEAIGSLMVKVADANLSLTNYAEDIYRNQVAMLIRNDYYTVLYMEELLEAKTKAVERGKIQFEMVELSYNNGMKAKDDYLMAKMYYDSTVIAQSLAQAEYKNALYDLKRDMNLGEDEILELTGNLDAVVTEENLEEALSSGVLNRFEIQKCLAQLTLAELNEEMIDEAGVSSKEKYKETEASLLVDEAELALEKNRDIVVTEILQSWELMTAAGVMVESSDELIADAEAVAAIASLKYEQGYGTETALLSSMGLESSGGTILELIAAEENLTAIEAQVAYINYSYIMARCKFQNDAGMLYD